MNFIWYQFHGESWGVLPNFFLVFHSTRLETTRNLSLNHSAAGIIIINICLWGITKLFQKRSSWLYIHRGSRNGVRRIIVRQSVPRYFYRGGISHMVCYCCGIFQLWLFFKNSWEKTDIILTHYNDCALEGAILIWEKKSKFFSIQSGGLLSRT